MAILDNTSLAYMNKRNKGNPVLNQYFATSGNQLTPEALQGMVQGELDARYANQQQQKELQLRREQLEYQKMSDQRTYDMQSDAIKSARNMGIVSNLVGAGTAIAGNWDKIKDTTVGRGLSSVGGAIESGVGAVGTGLQNAYYSGKEALGYSTPRQDELIQRQQLASEMPAQSGWDKMAGDITGPQFDYSTPAVQPMGPGSIKQSVFGQKNASPSQPIIAQKTPDTVMAIENLSPVTPGAPTTAAINTPYTNIKQAEAAEGKEFWDISPITNAWNKTVGKEGIGGQFGTWLDATGKFQDTQNAQFLAEVNQARKAGKTPDYAGLRKKYPKSGTGAYGFVRRF